MKLKSKHYEKKNLLLLIALTFSNLGFSQLNEIHLAYPDTFNIRAVSEKNGTLYCIASRYKTYLFNRTFLLKSTDTGDSWTVLNQFTLTNSPLIYSAVNDSIHYIVSPDYKLLRSTDMCSSLDTVLEVFAAKNSFYAINKDTIVASGYVINKGSHLFVSRNAFQTIDTLKVSSIYEYNGYNRGLSIINDSVWVTLTNIKGQNNAALIRTQNAGISWDTINTLNIDIDRFRSMSFKNNQGVLLAYSNDYPYKNLLLSTDSGNTFSVVDSFNTYGDSNFREASICTNGNIYLWNKSTDHFVFFENNGAGWLGYSLQIPYQNQSHYYNFHALYINDTTIILDTYEMQWGNPPDPSKGLHKIYRVDVNSLSIHSATKTNAEFTVFPNPFYHSLKIRTPKNFSGRIRLSDLFGRIIMEREQKNINSMELNNLDIEPGIYFIHLETIEGKSLGTVKMIKL